MHIRRISVAKYPYPYPFKQGNYYPYPIRENCGYPQNIYPRIHIRASLPTIHSYWTQGCRFRYRPNLKYSQYRKHSLHNFCKQPKQPDFHFKISGFLAAIKLTDKSG